MTTTPAKPHSQSVPDSEGAASASEPVQPGAKTNAARAAQEDRLAAALRANLARRKAASRASRQGAPATDDDDVET